MIPKGMANGFLALEDDVLMADKLSSVYAPENDVGIRWDSFGLDWSVDRPIVLERDRSHPTLTNFTYPFLI